jgi:GTPase
MAEMYEIKEQEERFVLVGVAASDSDDTVKSLEELEELAATAGAVTVGRIIQNRESIHPGTYIGKGKIDEVRTLALETGATGVVCDDELTPVQLKNLEDALQMKVLDRTVIILDIFANRASTKEGKIQVELAQLRYRSTRLIGLRNSLSRLGGGIGTRGPGEKKLEMDRRIIKERITQLKRELEEVKQNRETSRSLRSKKMIPVVAIVGYTNAGKSTLLNHLTDAGVLEEDKLFATLDPTTRALQLENGQQILLTDTVGFIRKLPHHLIEAFRSTLEEAKYADIILHVVDSSNPDAFGQMHIVYDTLNKLGIQDKVIITAFNKQDKLGTETILKDFKADHTVKISAKTGADIDKLLLIIEKVLSERKVLLEKVFSYQDAGQIQTVRKYGQLLEEEYQQEGIYVKAYVPKEVYQTLF